MRAIRILAQIIIAALTLAACGSSEVASPLATIPITILTPFPTPSSPAPIPFPNPAVFEEKKRLGMGRVIKSAVSPTGDRIALVTALSIFIYDIDSQSVQVSWDISAYSLESIAWSPDGDRLAYGSETGIINVWDVRINQHILIIAAHSSYLISLNWSPNGAAIASLGADGYIRAWNPDSGKKIMEYSIDAGIWSVDLAWSPNGDYLKALHQSILYTWEFPRGTLMQTSDIGLPVSAFSMALSPDGTQIIFVNERSELHIWDIEFGREDLTGFDYSGNFPGEIIWSPDGSMFASITNNRTVTIFNASAFGRPIELPWTTVSEIDWLPGGENLLIRISDGSLIMWVDGQSSLVPLPRVHTQPVASLVWSPDGSQLASVEKSGKAIFWDVAAAENARSLDLFELSAAAWSPDFTQVAVIDEKGAVRLVDAQSGQLIKWLYVSSGNFSSAAWSPDGDRLAVINRNGSVNLWDQETGQTILLREGFNRSSTNLTWSPDGSKLAASVDALIYTWDMLTLSIDKFIVVEPFGAGDISWSPYGNRLAFTNRYKSGQFSIWDASMQDQPIVVEGPTATAIAWSPYERMLASSDTLGQLMIWDTTTWQPIQTINTGSVPIESIVWSPDGSMFATADAEGLIRIWGLKSQ